MQQVLSAAGEAEKHCLREAKQDVLWCISQTSHNVQIQWWVFGLWLVIG